MDRACEVCGKWFVPRKGAGQGRWCCDRCRLWGKVDVAGADDCWEWRAALTGKGYGKIQWGRRYVNAHRVVYEHFHGPIPKGLLVLHRCDNRVCVNPAHLFVGTAKDNADDMMRKGRGRGANGEVLTPHAHWDDQANWYINARGEKICRVCAREAKKRKAKRKGVGDGRAA